MALLEKHSFLVLLLLFSAAVLGDRRRLKTERLCLRHGSPDQAYFTARCQPPLTICIRKAVMGVNAQGCSEPFTHCCPPSGNATWGGCREDVARGDASLREHRRRCDGRTACTVCPVDRPLTQAQCGGSQPDFQMLVFACVRVLSQCPLPPVRQYDQQTPHVMGAPTCTSKAFDDPTPGPEPTVTPGRPQSDGGGENVAILIGVVLTCTLIGILIVVFVRRTAQLPPGTKSGQARYTAGRMSVPSSCVHSDYISMQENDMNLYSEINGDLLHANPDFDATEGAKLGFAVYGGCQPLSPLSKHPDDNVYELECQGTGYGPSPSTDTHSAAKKFGNASCRNMNGRLLPRCPSPTGGAAERAAYSSAHAPLIPGSWEQQQLPLDEDLLVDDNAIYESIEQYDSRPSSDLT